MRWRMYFQARTSKSGLFQSQSYSEHKNETSLKSYAILEISSNSMKTVLISFAIATALCVLSAFYIAATNETFRNNVTSIFDFSESNRATEMDATDIEAKNLSKSSTNDVSRRSENIGDNKSSSATSNSDTSLKKAENDRTASESVDVYSASKCADAYLLEIEIIEADTPPTLEQVKQFEAHPECFSWPTFYQMAYTLFEHGGTVEQKDKAVFYMYLGQTRARVGAPFGAPDGAQALYSALQFTVGGDVNAYAGEDIPKLIQTLERVQIWDLNHPYTKELEGLQQKVSEAEWQQAYTTVRQGLEEYIALLKDQDALNAYFEETEEINESILYAIQKGYDSANKVNLSNMRVHAEVYYDANSNSYKSVCKSEKFIEMLNLIESTSSADLGGEFICNDSDISWAATYPLHNGSLYCVDSIGHSYEVKEALKEKLRCPTQ